MSDIKPAAAGDRSRSFKVIIPRSRANGLPRTDTVLSSFPRKLVTPLPVCQGMATRLHHGKFLSVHRNGCEGIGKIVGISNSEIGGAPANVLDNCLVYPSLTWSSMPGWSMPGPGQTCHSRPTCCPRL